jgi:hypothetical protein
MYKKYRITYIDYEQEDGLDTFTINVVDHSIKDAIDSFYKEYSDCDVNIKGIEEID